MSRSQRIRFGFIGIAVSAFVGAMSVKGRFEPGQIFATIAGVLFFFGAYRAIFSVKPFPGDNIPDPVRGNENLARRLADIQEIVISIDDRLKRLESRSAPTSGPKPQVDIVA